MNKLIHLIIATILFSASAVAQNDSLDVERDILDSLYIIEVEEAVGPVKVLHAEPLYIDLIRDLGARKGEKEWNVGAGLTDNLNYDAYETLVEYEWAPLDRLGLEIELPFSFYYPSTTDIHNDSVPGSKLNSFKLAQQYTFAVSDRHKMSWAFGCIQEVELAEFRNYSSAVPITGIVLNPFIIGAKRWKQNFHTLLYAGPRRIYHLHDNHTTTMQVNSSFHYMISGTRNFVGIEFNKSFTRTDFDMTIRPQMRLSITEHLLLGIAMGVPVKRENQRFSTFFRLIYEPKH